METPSQLQPQLHGTSGSFVFSGFNFLFFECFSSQQQRQWAEQYARMYVTQGEHSQHHRAGAGEEAKMLCANRLSHSAHNVALKGWVSVQISLQEQLAKTQ